MDMKQKEQTAIVLSKAVEVASGILCRIDGNDISSSQDGPRDIEQRQVELWRRVTHSNRKRRHEPVHSDPPLVAHASKAAAS